MRIHDPGHAALSRALRVAAVAPLGFAITQIAGAGPQLAVFASFGLFALLAMADFGGPPRRRFGAYLAATAIGAVLIVIGTPASREPVAAAAVTLPIVFAIRFGGNLGGQEGAAVTPLTLAFVLAVAVEAPPGSLEDRLVGWLGAGLLAGVAAVVLWPRYERPELLGRLGAAIDAAGEAVATGGAGRAAAELQALRDDLDADPLRHSGSMSDEWAYRRIVDELVRFGRLLPLGAPELPEGEALCREMEATLRDAAAIVAGRPDGPDVARLERARLEHRRALEAEALRRIEAGEAGAEEVIDELDRAFPLRIASVVALAIAADALLLGGRPFPESADLEVRPGVGEIAARVGSIRHSAELALARLRPGSTRLRDAVRGGAAISLAVLVAGVSEISHGFWVVLATLMVLKSNAHGTGRTAFAAIGGTTLGFLIAAPLMLAIGTGATGLWIVLPFVTFAAAYASVAINVAAGQASFALFVVILFNLIQPTGWEVGLVRVETVVLGTLVSVVVGFLFWPRGALGAVGRAAASAYRNAAGYLRDVLGEEVDSRRAERDRLRVRGATVQSIDSIQQHRSEPGVHLTLEQVTALIDGPRLTRAAADGLVVLTRIYPGPGGEAPSVRAAGTDLAAGLDRIADSVQRAPDEARPRLDGGLLDRTREDAVAAVRRWAADPDHAEGPLRIVWQRDWLAFLAVRLDELEPPTREAARLIARPWWRG